MEFQSEPGRFFRTDETGYLLAEVTFQTIDDGKAFAIDHTYVDESLRGQGVAAQLIEQVVTLARQEHKTIQPLCSYAVHAFAAHPEYADVRRPTNDDAL